MLEEMAPYHNANTGRLACHMSHLKALREAFKDPSTRNVLVFEDDAKTNFSIGKMNHILQDAMTHLPAD